MHARKKAGVNSTWKRDPPPRRKKDRREGWEESSKPQQLYGGLQFSGAFGREGSDLAGPEEDLKRVGRQKVVATAEVFLTHRWVV